MSRNRVYLDGEEIFPDKSSGILIATGTATRPRAWYSNIHQCYFDRQDSFSSEEEYARIILTENADKPKATLYKDQKLIIDSYNDNKGTVCPDSHLEHAVDFSIGAQAEIKISDTKLNVLRR